MKRFGTIKFRITIWYSVFIMFLLLITLFVLYFFSLQAIKTHIAADTKSDVMLASHELARQRILFKTGKFTDSGEFKNVAVYSEQGQYVAGKNMDEFKDIPFESEAVRYVKANGRKYIVYDYFKEIRDLDGMWVRGASEIDLTKYFNGTLYRFVNILIPIIFLATVFGGYIIIKIAFKPINKIIDTANDISAQNDISKRIPINANSSRDELHSMAETLNNMLDKIQKQFEREKQITLDISHELRTPVSVILSYSEYLSRIVESKKEKELAESIVEQSKKMTHLISTLLMLSRIENGRQTLSNENVNIGELLEAVAAGLEDKAAQKNINIETQTQSNITMQGDEALLMSAFVNIVDNAIKYGRSGGFVKIKVCKKAYKAEITFEDNGIGISEENIEKIWDSFFRADESHSSENKGCGLGLPLVKSIVNLHGGDIKVSSKLGEGTVFKIVFNI